MDKAVMSMKLSEKEIHKNIKNTDSQENFTLDLKIEIKVENQLPGQTELSNFGPTFDSLIETKHQEKVIKLEEDLNVRIPTDERQQKTSQVNAAAKDSSDKTLFSYVMTKHKRDSTNQSVHSNQKKEFQCETCLKEFTYSQNLKRHQLKKHLLVHSGERPYKCKICDKAFSQSSALKYHFRIHSGEKPYKCPLCERAFTQSSTLKVHQLFHSGEKPFKCQLCQREFAQSTALKIHQSVHTGNKPFKCQVCEKEFSNCSNLKSHQRVHTKKQQ
ncbi:zinc finger protein 664 [Biomphalaria glabrata]|nr:zinc finger protein 664-like [Biomphalaria glabrata]